MRIAGTLARFAAFAAAALAGILLAGTAFGASKSGNERASAKSPAESRRFWASIADNNCGVLTNMRELDAHRGKLLLSWRMLPGDTARTAFDIRKRVGSRSIKINAAPIADSTNFQVPEKFVDFAADNTFELCASGSRNALETLTVPAERLAERRPYVSIFMKETASDARIADVPEYLINDGGIADLDGDGNDEILVKRHAYGENSAGTPLPKSRAILEAYRLDGTFLWRVVFGPNIAADSMCFFIAADFDGDGKAEIAVRTSEGTSFGDGKTIGDTDGDGKTDYARPGKYNADAPEFLSVLDGATGAELARAPFVPIRTSEEWGDDYFRRASCVRIAAAKLRRGNAMQLVACRGIYAKTVLEAWEFSRSHKALRRLWTFNSEKHPEYASQGNHQLAVADVDGDGLDEITYGACAFDHDGSGLYSTRLGHGDMLHLGKFVPARAGLQVWSCFETGTTRAAMRDAATGEILWKLESETPGDEGRCLVADIDPESPGCEAWVFDRVVYTQDGAPAGGVPAPSVNFPIWWTGSLNRQMFDDRKIDCYRRDGGNARVFTLYRYDVACANWSKNNACFIGDFLGDWREEIIIARRHPTGMTTRNRPLPGSSELMIFSTWIPTEYKFPYLMSDAVYYRAAVHQNLGYNSPNHLGVYLGSDLVPAGKRKSAK